MTNGQRRKVVLSIWDERCPTLKTLGTTSKGDGDLVGVDVGVVVLALLLDGFAEVTDEECVAFRRIIGIDPNLDALIFLRVAHDTHFVGHFECFLFFLKDDSDNTPNIVILVVSRIYTHNGNHTIVQNGGSNTTAEMKTQTNVLT